MPASVLSMNTSRSCAAFLRSEPARYSVWFYFYYVFQRRVTRSQTREGSSSGPGSGPGGSGPSTTTPRRSARPRTGPRAKSVGARASTGVVDELREEIAQLKADKAPRKADLAAARGAIQQLEGAGGRGTARPTSRGRRSAGRVPRFHASRQR